MRAGSVSINGPPIKSMQYGIAANTASKHSPIALGLPGRLTIKDPPLGLDRMPAVCRERIAVGTLESETWRINSPNPGSILSQTATVASGVTSRGAGPVPPVVIMRQHSCSSHSSTNVCSIKPTSSEITLVTGTNLVVTSSDRY